MYKYLVLLSVFFCCCHVFVAEVVTYAAPLGVEKSAYYKIMVLQNGLSKESFTHVTHAQVPKYNRSKTTSWSNFSFKGKVVVKIEKLYGRIDDVKILPGSRDIVADIEGNTLSFELSAPENLAVEINGDITHPLLIFANPLEENIPDPLEENVLYFGPGVHDLDEDINLKSNQTVYLAGGAVVSALIRGQNVKNVTIRGRGVLLGRKFPHSTGTFIKVGGDDASDILIEGITIVDAPGYNITSRANNTRISNVKTIGWWFNTDGISAGPNAIVEDCFLKCNDDALKLYLSGMRVTRTSIWQMENGSPFQISWNMPFDNSDFIVKDCDVIHCDHEWDNPNEAVFDAIHGGGGHMSNYLFEDIRIENAPWRLVSIQILRNQWSTSSPEPGRISNLKFNNIQVTTPNGRPLKRMNVIQGFSEEQDVSNVHFTNLQINGEMISSAHQGRFMIDPSTTSEITFESSGKSQPVTVTPEVVPSDFQNPIKNGLNSYGQRDFFIFREDGVYYLVATEAVNPEWPKRGVMLYSSSNLTDWHEVACLINRNSLTKDKWFRDEWLAPEIHKIDGRYVLTFNCRNNQFKPYGKTSIGYAVAEKITGPYKVVTVDKPLADGNNLTLFEDGNDVWGFWDDDGIIYSAKVDVGQGGGASRPKEMLSPRLLNFEDRYLDAPCIYKKGKKYFMLYSRTRGGYYINYAVASAITGPWIKAPNNPLFARLEDEAETELSMPFGKKYPFAPPTEITGSVNVFIGLDNKTWLSYHSQDKYAEPYLCIDPIEFSSKGKIEFLGSSLKKK